jgi:ArsR family metal-binding transcriptional regulator
MSQNLISSYEINLAAPECHQGSNTYSGVVNLKDDISEALPYLNAEMGGYDYYHNDKILLWANKKRMYAFRPREIAIAPVSSLEEAKELAESIIERVNDIWNRRNEIKPNFEGKKPLPNVLDIYKLLPRTNCRECGFLTCMAFAAKLRSDSTKSSLCPHLSEQEYVKLLH